MLLPPLSTTRRRIATRIAGALALLLPAALGAQAVGDATRSDTTVQQHDAVIQATRHLTDTTARLSPVVVEGARPSAVGRLPDLQNGIPFRGKKTERLQLDSLGANVSQDVSRQILGRIPGANFSEIQGSGFPSNGVGFRGLDPTQSIEVNTRQNGINIAADLYGYPETYYTPPMEAVDHIDVVRGASALQFGPQFGGAIDYVTRSGTPDSPPVARAHATGGSFGSFGTFADVGGGTGRLTYYGYVQYRGEDGWRPNADFRQTSAYAKLGWRASDRVMLGLEYSLFRNRIHMPGGLSDAQFAADPRASFRARNWLASPWNILALTLDAQLSASTRLLATTSAMLSQRYLVWRNEDGGPAAPDDIDPATGEYVPREVERERFRNVTTEARIEHDHSLFGRAGTLSSGARVFAGTLGRQEGGPGSTGTDFDMSLVGGPYESDLSFGTRNVALFAEEMVRITDRWSITPGARWELLRSTASGHEDTNVVAPPAKTRSYPLFGIGTQLDVGRASNLYANITQAYRPITYDFLTPFASASVIDRDLRDAKGWNADLGWRGALGPALRFDVGVFYLRYDHRIGVVSMPGASGETITEVTNVARSTHKGVESYVEVAPFAWLGASSALAKLRLFDSFAYVDARYAAGPFAGNHVEAAPPVINRTGASFAWRTLSTTLQWSHTARSFSDANNTVASDDPGVGLVPAYDVIDWSGALSLGGRYTVSVGVNNLADARYFTKRTNEYPGPGIIPAIGRSVYASVGVGVR